MNWTVTWLPLSLAQLADVWTTATDRDAVTAASYRIDRALEVDPFEAGESRDGDDRVVIDHPLVVSFRVLPGQRLVQVMSCARNRRRRP
jgi:hypothetical protein